MKTLITLIVILCVGAAAVWFFTSTDANGPQAASCLDAVQAAQESAQGTFCTQQVQELVCPQDGTFFYTAQNGCEISHLRNDGWLIKNVPLEKPGADIRIEN